MRIFLTGTGTDVGKTYVSAGLAWQICQQDKKDFLYIKPIASGVDKKNADVKEVLTSIKQFSFAKAEGWYAFKEPASPYIAAKAEKKAVPYQEILNRFKLLEKEDLNLLVEGAGGVFVPLTESKLVIDLMVDLNFPIVVVAHYGLGTVNHTCLTIEALRKRNCQISGIILNHTLKTEIVEYSLAASTNKAEIERLTNVPILGILKYGDRPDSQNFLNIWQQLSK